MTFWEILSCAKLRHLIRSHLKELLALHLPQINILTKWNALLCQPFLNCSLKFAHTSTYSVTYDSKLTNKRVLFKNPDFFARHWKAPQPNARQNKFSYNFRGLAFGSTGTRSIICLTNFPVRIIPSISPAYSINKSSPTSFKFNISAYF